MAGDDDAVGRVLGTEDATPLEFWVGIDPECGQYLQLDDVVALDRRLPDGRDLRISGVVSQVRARHEGSRFDGDVFLVSDGVLPADLAESAQVQATRFEPEVFVPPHPGTPVRRATGTERDEALFFDRMRLRLPVGLSRAGEPVFANLEFLDGTRGAHVNISGISGVATKTTYATFLLHSLFHSGVLGGEAHNTRALIFNVKGEDLLFLDHDNRQLDPAEHARYEALGLTGGAFKSVELWAPPRRGATTAVPDTGARLDGVSAFFWTLDEFCSDELLPFLFADAADDRQQYTMIVHHLTAKLKREAISLGDGGVRIEGRSVRTFRDFVDILSDLLESEDTASDWAGRAIGVGTINAFIRRLHSAGKHLDHLIHGDFPNPERHRIAREQQISVVDIHNLHDRAKRFVVGVVLRRTFEDKERSGQARPLVFVVLDELNKYAPRDGSSPIKEVLLDIAERGRSLGIILVGAQQTASEVERRIIGNSSIRVVGRLDTAEAGREEYGFLPPVLRQRATLAKPGTMILSQPELPVPLVCEFPFPAWATRPSEAGVQVTDRVVAQPEDPFADLDGDDGLPF